MGLKTTGNRDDLLARIRGEVRNFPGRGLASTESSQKNMLEGLLVENERRTCCNHIYWMTEITHERLSPLLYRLHELCTDHRTDHRFPVKFMIFMICQAGQIGIFLILYDLYDLYDLAQVS